MNSINVTRHEPNAATITLPRNVLGGTDAMEFASRLRELSEQGVRCVVVDLSQVELMNSSGLGMLVSGLSTLRRLGGSLKFAAIPAKVQGLLKMTQLDTVFETYESAEAALASHTA